jgi:hypothetical protein
VLDGAVGGVPGGGEVRGGGSEGVEWGLDDLEVENMMSV